jgi:GDP-L-fucose synthase
VTGAHAAALDRTARVFVAGHRGLVGSAIVRALGRAGFRDVIVRTRQELDLRDPASVAAFFQSARPSVVFLAAAKVGGILANSTAPAEFLRDNLLIQTAVFEEAHRARVRKLVFLGSSCIYPKHAPQPIREDALLTGPLEPTNRAYAIAKIAGIEAARAYRAQHGLDAISLMPTNLYGPGDNFDLATSHVLPALIRRFHEAKEQGAREVVLWGTGTPRRELLHVDDLAEAAVVLADRWSSDEIVNVGTGVDHTIRELAELVGRVVGYEGAIAFDASKPDGTPRKVLDVSRIRALGWAARIPLEDGVRATYAWYRQNPSSSPR